MTDRVIVYDGALPQSTDILQTNKFGMVSLAFQAAAALGQSTVVNGLACTQSSPSPNLFVNVAPGSIYSMVQTDAIGYGDLGVDLATIVKQGILYTAVSLQITPPSTVGYSQVFLVQAEYADQDTGTAVLPYFNANNPSQPFTGPANSGNVSQFTIRQGLCNISLVAGIALPTGTQQTPAPLFGNTGLFAITVANGQTQIVNANIVTLPSAPFFPSLPAVPPGVQQNAWTYAVDTGVVNALIATVWPIPAALVPGLIAVVKVGFTNTGPATLNLNGLGAVAIHRATGAVLSSGDMTAGQICSFMYDGSAWQILNFTGATTGTVTNNFNSYVIPYAVATGTANALLATFTPSVPSLTAGLIVLVKAILNNTSATTLTPLALATTPIIENQLPLLPNAIVNGEVLVLVYDGASFQKLNSRNQVFSFNAGSPPASDIPMQVGDILNIAFTSVQQVPLKVASVPGVYEIECVITSGTGNISDADPYLLPNNATQAGTFTTWAYSTGYPEGGGGFYGYPQSLTWTSSTGGPYRYFNFDLMIYGSNVGAKINAPPLLFKMTASTYTNAKMVRCIGGISGGTSNGFCLWSDTTTAWTSLGIVQVTDQPPPLPTMSGNITVRRVA